MIKFARDNSYFSEICWKSPDDTSHHKRHSPSSNHFVKLHYFLCCCSCQTMRCELDLLVCLSPSPCRVVYLLLEGAQTARLPGRCKWSPPTIHVLPVHLETISMNPSFISHWRQPYDLASSIWLCWNFSNTYTEKNIYCNKTNKQTTKTRYALWKNLQPQAKLS